MGQQGSGLRRRAGVAACLLGFVVATGGAHASASRQLQHQRAGRVVTVQPVPAWKPGNKVWHVAPPPPSVIVFSPGCERVPPTGFIGSGAYAQTGTHTTTNWNWSDSSSLQPFHWYVFTPGGTIKAHARSEGGGGGVLLANGGYYWKVQNLGSAPQAWNVCWS